MASVWLRRFFGLVTDTHILKDPFSNRGFVIHTAAYCFDLVWIFGCRVQALTDRRRVVKRHVQMPKEQGQIVIFLELLERFVKDVNFFLPTCNMEDEDPEQIWEQMQEFYRL